MLFEKSVNFIGIKENIERTKEELLKYSKILSDDFNLSSAENLLIDSISVDGTFYLEDTNSLSIFDGKYIIPKENLYFTNNEMMAAIVNKNNILLYTKGKNKMLKETIEKNILNFDEKFLDKLRNIIGIYEKYAPTMNKINTSFSATKYNNLNKEKNAATIIENIFNKDSDLISYIHKTFAIHSTITDIENIELVTEKLEIKYTKDKRYKLIDENGVTKFEENGKDIVFAIDKNFKLAIIYIEEEYEKISFKMKVLTSELKDNLEKQKVYTDYIL